MTWDEVKAEIRAMLLFRNLKNPRIRLNALESLDRLFARYLPEVRKDPRTILRYDKNKVIEKLSRGKANGRLNSAEKSVLNNIYQVLSAGRATLSTTRSGRPQTGQVEQVYSPDKSNKLAPLARMLSELLEAEIGQKAGYSLESSQGWMKSVPDKGILEAWWEEIARAYSLLVDQRYTLDDRLRLVPGTNEGAFNVSIFGFQSLITLLLSSMKSSTSISLGLSRWRT